MNTSSTAWIASTTDDLIADTYSRNNIHNAKVNIMKERDLICNKDTLSNEDQELVNKANHLLNQIAIRRDFLFEIYAGYLLEEITNHFHYSEHDYPDKEDEFVSIIRAEMRKADKKKHHYTPKKVFSQAFRKLEQIDDVVFNDLYTDKHAYFDAEERTAKSFRKDPNTNQNFYTMTELWKAKRKSDNDNLISMQKAADKIANMNLRNRKISV